MRAGLDGKLRILAEALQLANRRAMDAAGAASRVDGLTEQQLLATAHALAQLELAVWDTHTELFGVTSLTEAGGNPAASPGDYPEGPQ